VAPTEETIAAAYLRKSTDEGGKDLDAKSVFRQHQGAEAFAKLKSWTLAEDFVFTDDGISGAEFGKKRPGLQRLLDALSPRPPFQVLIISEQSRLGRDTIRTLATIQRIQDAGVRIFSYLDDREITIEQDTDEIQEFIRSWSSSQERKKAIQRTRDAMHAKARNGYVAGGKVLGYTNVREGSNVRRVVNAKEARLVARIFQLCAEGNGLLRIAKKLNEEGVANPTGQFRQSAGDPASATRLAAHWSATGIREILNRRLYVGEVVYGQTRWVRRGGTKRKVRVPESEWIRTTDPRLRIISDDLWQAAHARLGASRAVYLGPQRRQAGPEARGRPGVQVPALGLPALRGLRRQHGHHDAHGPARPAPGRLHLRDPPLAAGFVPRAQRATGR
jgi:site-specific DNA recombinase